jgi:hypothetical protein
MNAQQPAKGVLQVNDWGTSKMYKAVCECGDNDCTHTIDVEAEDTGVIVTIYTMTRTNFWSKSRWSHIWKLLTKGHADFETCIIMSRQVALNYANVLQSAVKDVEDLRNEQANKRST